MIKRGIIMDDKTRKTAGVFGRNLALQRKNNKLTQLQLSKEMGVDDSTISCWERGNREPNFEMLIKLAEYFDISTDYLLNNKDNCV
jgi:transcriptional regulator with XRE-family HTH domain